MRVIETLERYRNGIPTGEVHEVDYEVTDALDALLEVASVLKHIHDNNGAPGRFFRKLAIRVEF